MWPFRSRTKQLQGSIETLWGAYDELSRRVEKGRDEIDTLDDEVGVAWRAVWDLQTEVGELIKGFMATLDEAPIEVREAVQRVLEDTDLGQELALRLDAEVGNDLVLAAYDEAYASDFGYIGD